MATVAGTFPTERRTGRVANFIVTRPALTIAWIVSVLALIGTIGLWLFKGHIANDFSVYWRTANLPLYWGIIYLTPEIVSGRYLLVMGITL